MKGGLLFTLSLWMAISVALLSALAPLGPPSSRLTGSAFNPATTSVVLKARAQAIPIAVRATRPDGGGRVSLATPAMIWLLPMAAMMIGFRLLRSANRFSRPRPAPRPSHRHFSHHARAPPELS